MRKLLASLGGLALLVVVAWVGAGMTIRWYLSGERLQGLVSSLQSALGVPVRIDRADFDLRAWFRFRPAITLMGLQVDNPEGFGSKPLMTIEKASAEVALWPLFRHQLQVLGLVLERPGLRIEVDGGGNSNVVALLARRPREPGALGAAAGSLAAGWTVQVKALTVRHGLVEYRTQSGTYPQFNQIDLEVMGLGGSQAVPVRFHSKVFVSQALDLAFRGQLQRGEPGRLPVEGELKAELEPARLSLQDRARYFGALLRVPAATSRVRFNASLRGDLRTLLLADGHVEAKGLPLGQSQQRALPLNCQVPFQLEAEHLLERPVFHLVIREATASLGQGQWRGDLAFLYDGQWIQGTARGTLEGVLIEQMLDAFTEVRNAVYGKLRLRDGKFSFRGRTAAELRDSLNGTGRLEIEQGHLRLFDLYGTLERQFRRVLAGETPAAGETKFLALSSGLEVADRRLRLRGLELKSDRALLQGEGTITFDKQLDFRLKAFLGGELARLLGGRPDASGRIVVAVPVTIRGPLERPAVRPDFASLIRDRVRGALDSLFQR